MSSAVLKKSQGSKAQLALVPTDLVLVCEPREKCDPVILQLADEGFLVLRHTENRRAIGFDERSGTVVPTPSFLWGVKEHGVLEPARITRDGKVYVVSMGRTRVKACAMLNRAASEEAGKRVEPFTVPAVILTANEAGSYQAMVIENAHRTDDGPMVRARKIRDGFEVYNQTMDVMCDLFQMSETNIQLAMRLHSLSEPLARLVDSGDVKPTLAARRYAQFPREQQLPAYEKLLALGIKHGARADMALERMLRGEEPVDAEDTEEREDDSPDSGGDNGGNDSGGGRGSADTGEKPKKKAAKEAAGPDVVRALSKAALGKLVDRLKEPAKKPEVPDLPSKFKGPVDAAIRAAYYEGARAMAARQLGKTRGFGPLKAVLEADDTESEAPAAE